MIDKARIPIKNIFQLLFCLSLLFMTIMLFLNETNYNTMFENFNFVFVLAKVSYLCRYVMYKLMNIFRIFNFIT